MTSATHTIICNAKMMLQLLWGAIFKSFKNTMTYIHSIEFTCQICSGFNLVVVVNSLLHEENVEASLLKNQVKVDRLIDFRLLRLETHSLGKTVY